MPEISKFEYDSILVTPWVDSFEQFVERGEKGEHLKASFLIPVTMLTLADNIRPKNQRHIDALALSIRENGQKQPASGDIMWSEEYGCMVPRLIAGRHRYEGILKNERDKKDESPEERIWIVLENRTLDPYEVIDLQLAENIHEKLMPSEEAATLHSYWRRLRELKMHDNEKLTVSSFANRVGRSTEVITNAIKYMEKGSSIVQKLVDENILPFGIAVLLADVPVSEEDLKKGFNEQVRLALFFINKKYTTKKAAEYLKNGYQGRIAKRINGMHQASLLPEDVEEEALRKDTRRFVKVGADVSGMAALRWFSDIKRVINMLEPSEQIMLTEAVLAQFSHTTSSYDQLLALAKDLLPEKQVKVLTDSNHKWW